LQSMGLGVFSDPLRDRSGGFHGHNRWAVTPALIVAEVDITMITCKITATV